MFHAARAPIAATLFLVSAFSVAAAEDWPTHRHDNQRTGFTAERIDAARLREAWVWRSSQAPAPAWYGPAKADAYHGFGGFRSMREYDRALGLIVAAGRVYSASNADDAVRCLDGGSGKVIWTFTAGGPVRVAPSWADGKLYFGSDDGFAYCLDAAAGKLIWKVRAAKDDRRIICNGRLISLWPVRTGVLVAGGTAYFGAGLLPWEDSYLCAVDAATGEVARQGGFVRQYPALPRAGNVKKLRGQGGFTHEGAMVAGEQEILLPQGCVGPALFKRADGSPAGGLGNGGCFAMLTGDGRWVVGPGNRGNTLIEFGANRKGVGKHGRAFAAAAGGGYFCVLAPKALSVEQIKVEAGKLSREKKWSAKLPAAYGVIIAGDTVFVGCQDQVRAFSAADGKWLWHARVEGKAYELAVAGGRLFVSTDTGAVYCFTPDAKLPWVAGGANGEPPPKAAKAAAAWGPYVEFLSGDSALVCWGTEKPMGTKLVYGRGGKFETISLTIASFDGRVGTTDHRAVMEGLQHNAQYEYYIEVAPETLAKYTLDTFFNYTLPSPAAGAKPFGDNGIYEKAAARILSASGVRQGVCLVLGCGEGRLAWELAKSSKLRVIGVDTDAKAVAAGRRKLLETGLYGQKLALHEVASLDELPIVGGFANLIVSDSVISAGRCAGTAAEVQRLLQPGRGVACIGQPAGAAKKLTKQALAAWAAPAAADAEISEGADGVWAVLRRAALKDAGVWTHEYGTAANAGYGGEHLGGAGGADQMTVQWIGRPGPRYQTDRNGRKPSPLCAGGRLFVQGQNRIVALDARNGSILWSLEIPLMLRMNVPIDCSNWCADDENIYAVVKDRCWRIDAATGEVEQTYPVLPGRDEKKSYEWGYVARCGDKLLGSAVASGSAFTNYWGRKGWYDHWQVAKVCTDTLFALDPKTGKHAWTYRGGMIPHSLIAAAEGKVYLIECRNEKVLAQPPGRIGLGELWQNQFVVCLDLSSGRKLWESPFECPGSWANVFLLAYAEGRLLAGGVNSPARNQAQNIVVALDAADGKQLWQQVCKGGGNHGATMQRPAAAEGKVFLRPMLIDLKTGKVEKKMPGGGCGTYALTSRSAIYRAGNVTMWDAETGRVSFFPRLRPDCWLSTIPAAGMILSPEGGGGCTCGNWLEMSAGFAPVPAGQ